MATLYKYDGIPRLAAPGCQRQLISRYSIKNTTYHLVQSLVVPGEGSSTPLPPFPL